MSDDKTRILTADEAKRFAASQEPADDKTRVLSADEAGRILSAAKSASKPAAKPGARRAQPEAAVPPEPQVVDGKIVFFCSRGHRIVVDAGLAGKRGNCSKAGCGVPVVIPTPPGLAPAEQSSFIPGLPEVVVEPPAAAAPLDLGFPAAVAEADTESATEPPAPAFAFGSGESEAEASPPELGFEGHAAAVDWAAALAEIDNPTARLVARLWLERAHGGIVEVHLSGGSVIMPEWFDAGWSSGTHALFAAQAADGTITLTAVAWDQIQKVVVRQVQGTPEGMFEG